MAERLHYRMSIRFFRENKAFGPGIAELLRRVEQMGSLQKAASSMGMAYSKAWKIIRDMEAEWGFSLTDRETGGRDGGGSRLTLRARELLSRYDRFLSVAGQAMDELFGEYFSEEWLAALEQMDETKE